MLLQEQVSPSCQGHQLSLFVTPLPAASKLGWAGGCALLLEQQPCYMHEKCSSNNTMTC